MSLFNKLAARPEAGTPIRVGVIGAGKFGSMFLAQAPRTPGLHVMGIADLDVGRAREAVRGNPAAGIHDVVLKQLVAAGQPVRWQDVAYDGAAPAIRFRREMERAFGPSHEGT